MSTLSFSHRSTAGIQGQTVARVEDGTVHGGVSTASTRAGVRRQASDALSVSNANGDLAPGTHRYATLNLISSLPFASFPSVRALHRPPVQFPYTSDDDDDNHAGRHHPVVDGAAPLVRNEWYHSAPCLASDPPVTQLNDRHRARRQRQVVGHRPQDPYERWDPGQGAEALRLDDAVVYL